MEFILELDRIGPGPPPRMKLTKRTLDKVGNIDINLKQTEIAHYVLDNLYNKKLLSQSKIGKILGVQYETIGRWLDRVGIKKRKRSDVVSNALSKYKKSEFSGNRKEAAYILGLRCGDIYAQKHGRNIRVSVGTTHSSMIKLFDKVFNKYGKVRYYPKWSGSFKFYSWVAYCDLDKSFRFLLRKPKNIPKYIVSDKDVFFEFLSGYFDAEGCISISINDKLEKIVQFIIKSCDKNLLDDMLKTLHRFDFHLNMRLVKKADGISYKRDYWYLGTGVKKQVLSLLNKMSLRHEEKISRYDLLKELEATDWINAKEKILFLRKSIKESVKRYKESSKLNLILKSNSK